MAHGPGDDLDQLAGRVAGDVVGRIALLAGLDEPVTAKDVDPDAFEAVGQVAGLAVTGGAALAVGDAGAVPGAGDALAGVRPVRHAFEVFGVVSGFAGADRSAVLHQALAVAADDILAGIDGVALGVVTAGEHRQVDQDQDGQRGF
jgi:hypothetical protein